LAAALTAPGRLGFRFHHVSTDEVFGSLGAVGQIHRDDAVSAELAVFGVEGGGQITWFAAWHETFGLPTVISNCFQQLRAHTTSRKR